MNVVPVLTASLLLGAGIVPGPVQGQVFFGTSAGPAGDSAQIVAFGTAELHVPVRRAVLYFQVASTDGDAAAAVRTNAASRARMVRALEGLGIEDGDVALWGYGTGLPADMRRPGPPSPLGAEDRWEARSGLRVVVDAVERVDEVVAAALEAGAHSLTGTLFDGDDTPELRREATRTAVARARQDAEAMAEAAGGRLGRLLSVTNMPDYSASMGMNRFFSGGYPGSGVNLMPVDLALRTSVQASWVFVPRQDE